MLFSLLPLLLAASLSAEAKMARHVRRQHGNGDGFLSGLDNGLGGTEKGLGGAFTDLPFPTAGAGILPTGWIPDWWPFGGQGEGKHGHGHGHGHGANATSSVLTARPTATAEATSTHLSSSKAASATSSKVSTGRAAATSSKASSHHHASASSSKVSSKTASSAHPSSTSTLSSFDSLALSGHNSFRKLYDAAPLSWNVTLAKAAQEWAGQCNWSHSGGAVGPYGENLAAGYSNVTAALQGWESEAANYSASNPVASHFTQMVWKGTTQLGCAVKSCDLSAQVPSFDYGDVPLYVCEYYPPGNVEPASNIAANVGSKS